LSKKNFLLYLQEKAVTPGTVGNVQRCGEYEGRARRHYISYFIIFGVLPLQSAITNYLYRS
jgi:hypothetical protein